jgi:hypothetical protein
MGYLLQICFIKNPPARFSVAVATADIGFFNNIKIQLRMTVRRIQPMLHQTTRQQFEKGAQWRKPPW